MNLKESKLDQELKYRILDAAEKLTLASLEMLWTQTSNTTLNNDQLNVFSQKTMELFTSWYSTVQSAVRGWDRGTTKED
jgi:hypothetical protein